MWGPNTSDTQWVLYDPLDLWHQRTRWKTLVSLLQKLDIEDIMAVLLSWWLRWSGHVQHATSCIKSGADLKWFAAPEGEEGPERRGPNVWQMMSVNVVCLALTHKTNAWRAPFLCCLVLPNPIGWWWDIESTLIPRWQWWCYPHNHTLCFTRFLFIYLFIYFFFPKFWGCIFCCYQPYPRTIHWHERNLKWEEVHQLGQ